VTDFGTPPTIVDEDVDTADAPSDTPALSPPPLVFEGAEWTSDELARLAWHWHRAARAHGLGDGLHALVLTNQPESVALFFALAALPAPLIVLPSDPRAWHSSPPVPRGSMLALRPGQEHLAPIAANLGLRPVVLPDARSDSIAGAPTPLPIVASATVLFTSGSTGAAKPVCRGVSGLITAAKATIAGYRLQPHEGIIASIPLATSHGLVQALLVPAMLGSSVALQERFDHRAVIDLFRSGRYAYWPAIPLMADVVSRARVDDVRPRAPRMCTVTGGGLSSTIFGAFRDRFGVALRSAYGATEAGLVAVPQDDEGLDPDDVGTPMPGVSVSIGETPGGPPRAGEGGRIWVKSPWYADGYGFPPALERPEMCDGWYATRDVGALDARGRLTLFGRLDDCFKTAGGRLVSAARIASVACHCPGVEDAHALPVRGAMGIAIGLIVSGHAVTADAIRHHLTAHLPEWSWPREIRIVSGLPRLAGGKVDRAACAAILEERVTT
jgi:O-succinylbenzoic acid--CoA ligase